MQIILFILLTLCITPSLTARAPYTVMIDPAGDARYSGRIIDNSFERGLTLQCAERIKMILEQTDHSLRVVLTRFPGEAATALQNATFANRMADLYISIHCCQQTDAHGALSIYYFCNDPTSPKTSLSLKMALIPAERAHQQAAEITHQYVHLLHEQLLAPNTASHVIHAPLGIPFLPLKGIICPAFALELSVKNSQDVLVWAQKITTALQAVIDKAQTERHTHE